MMVVRCTGLALVLLEVNGLDWCWLRRFLESMLRVIYRKDACMSHEHQCNAWGAKNGKMHAWAQFTHTNLF
jgi:hypothetical protein